MRRGSSGTVAATSATRTVLRCFAGGTVGALVAGDAGATVGNRPAGLPGVTPGWATGGSVTGGSTGPGALEVGCVEDPEEAVTTTSVADPLKELVLDVAVAISCTCSPRAAFEPTGTRTCSSSAWPTGTWPSLQVWPLASGQTVKLGSWTYIA
jgi:hypothetical protein